MKRSDYIAPTKRGDENYETIRELATAEGVIEIDAQPAVLGYANGAWSIVAGE